MAKIILELTEAQARVIYNHIANDLSYGEGGTFTALQGDEYVLDQREAAIAKRVLTKIEEALTQ